MSLANVVAVGRRPNLVLVGDPQQLASRRRARIRPAPARRARAPPRRPRHRARRSEVCSSRRRTGCTPTIWRSCPSFLRGPPRPSTLPSAASSSAEARRWARPALDPRRARRQQAVLRRGGGGCSDASSRCGRDVVVANGPSEPSRSTTSWSSRPTTPRSTRSGALPTARGSAPSTSSRVRRRRSSSSRWPPRAPPTRPEARVPAQPQPPQRRHLAGPGPRHRRRQPALLSTDAGRSHRSNSSTVCAVTSSSCPMIPHRVDDQTAHNS